MPRFAAKERAKSCLTLTFQWSLLPRSQSITSALCDSLMESGRLWCSEGAGVVRHCACVAAFTSTASGRLALGCANGASSAGGMLITGHDWHQKILYATLKLDSVWRCASPPGVGVGRASSHVRAATKQACRCPKKSCF